MTIRRSDWLWLSGILALALVLRAFKLDAGLWYDEIDTLVTSVRLPTRDVLTTYTSFNSHILFSLEAQASIALFGESAWSLRLPALIFGVASIGTLWWLARLVASPWEAHLSALLMAVSYHHIWFSQNARGYTGLLFWSLLATIVFLQNMRRSTWGGWAAYACVLVAAMYTHLTAAFFFAAQAIVYVGLLVRHRLGFGTRDKQGDDPRAENIGLKPLFGFALGGILVLTVYSVLLPQIIATLSNHVEVSSVAAAGGLPEWKSPIWTLLEIARSLQDLSLFMRVGLPISVVFIVVGIISLFRRHPVFTAFFLVHIPLTVVLLITLSFNIWPRFFFIDMGFILLSLVHGVFVATQYAARLLKTEKRWRISGTGLGVFATMTGILVSLLLLPPNYRHPKQDFVGAQKFVESSRTSTDKVASFGLASYPFTDFYAPHWDVVKTLDQLDKLRAGHRTWVVYAFPGHSSLNYPNIMDSLATDFELIQAFPGTLGDGEVLVFRSLQ